MLLIIFLTEQNMIKYLPFIIILPQLYFLFFCEAVYSQHDVLKNVQNRETNLVWADEFDEDGEPDSDNWIYETGFVRNEEYQWYQPNNARVENDLLIIEGRREQTENPDFDPDSDDWQEERKYANYSSTSMLTRGKHDWKFGRFEMRARIPAREGLWPAFWTLGVDGPWPENGEIDIMEYYDGQILANAAWGTEKPYTPKWDDTTVDLTEFEEGWADEFHIWRMDWDENSIRIYVDDILLNEVDLSETINPDGTNPFHQPHYLIVNLAIGGTQGGDPDETDFPARYEIDYIRVYEWAE